MSLWGGRFIKDSNIEFKKFNNSLKVDYNLFEEDVEVSISWSYMLYTINVINFKEYKTIFSNLKKILNKTKKNKKKILDSNDEDIHSWIERNLINKIGYLGKKLNTGKSRNEQITTDLKLWCKKKIKKIIKIIKKLQICFLNLSKKNKNTIISGYTHLQKAQPITFSHWCFAYIEMINRDINRLQKILKRLDYCPMGCGALSGTTYKIDRDLIAFILGFSKSTNNSLDTVSDRDYVIDIINSASISMIHLSRFAEDLIFFNTNELNYISLSDKFTSGSSLMPQKKNPDLLELIRGKCGRVQGSLNNILFILKGLPLSYNKDMQEDKECLFDTIKTWNDCIKISCLILKNIKLNTLICKNSISNGYLNATELAEYLVNKNIAFREAHNITGKIVLEAIKRNVPLEKLKLNTMKKFNCNIEKDIYKKLNLYSCLNRRNIKGGVSSKQIKIYTKKMQKKLNI
ncbi:Argininosuccinate lyase [Candidatus Annandia adelgestsuga]|uniref:Argininosuccinate lyase n=1 Tax=Candidatus Annandia adelgestsuga TaxID=1302411 RepID=A0A3S9J7X4_9ENTR|nr:argininosuccinate lyase [Candidatus Annandia adelgestsuga]AZP36414.1 Argininosuccinate lyase [Candidatus Annandia adelgestsuga]